MMWLGAKEPERGIPATELREKLFSVLRVLGSFKRVLIIPPDYTRVHSWAGYITEILWEFYGSKVGAILPALGTHEPMKPEEIRNMFGKVPSSLFYVHNWRKDTVTLGRIPEYKVKEISQGAVNYSWPVQVNKMLVEGNFDAIFSVGQVVPHEVAGMAGYNKNLFVGTGGSEAIHKSHFLGAAFGMERIMGKALNPVRELFRQAEIQYAGHLPVIYIQTVVGGKPNDPSPVKGLYIGDDQECFLKASNLALEVNFTMLNEPLSHAVVYLRPDEYRTTWLGNKSIYRTRMALADGGKLVVIAPGVARFGEDLEMDALIRKYGYRPSAEILPLAAREKDLMDNLGVAAHLIHGSSENRFRIVYCTEHIGKKDITGVGYEYMPLKEALGLYHPERCTEGWNILPNGERFYYISNPGLGLWSVRNRFENRE
ncbi:MAG: lactate racemase domain-containing protein [Bacteroidales bacterium]